jgi:NAD(P)-dependent dehydrogenase (short-subunit alcohol dehydrogenase family)
MGQRALVTAGASCTGREIARAFAANRAKACFEYGRIRTRMPNPAQVSDARRDRLWGKTDR